MKPDGGPAFACAAENGHQEGMSLRDFFAAHALALMASESDYPDAKRVAIEAYEVADAMLKARAA